MRSLFAMIVIGSMVTLSAAAAGSRYVVCANDQRFSNIDGINRIEDEPDIGSLSLLDFSVFPPEQTDIVKVPCSLIGPPTSVALTPGERFALVSAAMRIDPSNPSEQIPDNQVSVIDIEARKLVATLSVGRQPSGVSVSPDGRKAFICNRGDGSIEVLSIDQEGVCKEAVVGICEPGESLAHFAVEPDGSYGLASLHESAEVVKVGLVNGVPQKVEQRIAVGRGPYCIDFTPEGDVAVVANALGATISIMDTVGAEIRVVDTIYVGLFVEGLDISPDGRWLAVNCMMYTMNSPDHPLRQEYGQLILLERHGATYSVVQRMRIDRIPQSAVFTPDSRYVVVAGYEHQRLRVYELRDGLLHDTGYVYETPGRPCALRIAD